MVLFPDDAFMTVKKRLESCRQVRGRTCSWPLSWSAAQVSAVLSNFRYSMLSVKCDLRLYHVWSEPSFDKWTCSWLCQNVKGSQLSDPRVAQK